MLSYKRNITAILGVILISCCTQITFCAAENDGMSIIGLYPTGESNYQSVVSPIMVFEYQSEWIKPQSTEILINTDKLQLKNWSASWSLIYQNQRTIQLPKQSKPIKNEGAFKLQCHLKYSGNLHKEALDAWYRQNPNSLPKDIPFPDKNLQQSFRPEVLLVPAHGVSIPRRKPKPSLISWLFGAKTPKRIEPGSDSPPNVVMILVDTLRRDHTPPGGHSFIIAPHVDQLASLGVNFSQAYGASSSTRPSVGSIFTGLQPKAHGAVRHATQGAGLFLNAPRLAEAFKKAGHKTAAVSSNAQVSPAYGFNWGFDIFLSSVWESQVSLKGVEQLQTLDEPFFLYLHYMGPHQPYEPASPWKGMYQGHHAHAEQDAYAEEITQEDHQIGAIIKELAQQGLLDRTIVWLVSDHGEEFWEHGWNGHGANLFEESTQTVSIVSAPNVLPIGATIDEPVTHVDIFPTLSEIFSWKKNKYAQGFSLIPLINHKSNDAFAGRPLFLHHGGGNSAQPHFSDKDAVLLNKKKMVWWNQKDEWELYDLPTDPGEKKNIYQPNDPFIKSTVSLLEKHLSECQSITDSIKMLDESLPSLTPQEVENLKAHGYMQK